MATKIGHMQSALFFSSIMTCYWFCFFRDGTDQSFSDAVCEDFFQIAEEKYGVVYPIWYSDRPSELDTVIKCILTDSIYQCDNFGKHMYDFERDTDPGAQMFAMKQNRNLESGLEILWTNGKQKDILIKRISFVG